MTFIIASVVLLAAVSSAQFQVPVLGPGYVENPGDSLLHGFPASASGIPQGYGFGGSVGLGNFPGSFQRYPQQTGFRNPITSGFGNGFGDGGKQYATASPYSYPNIPGKVQGPSGVTDWNSPVSDWTRATPFGVNSNNHADHQALWPSDNYSHNDRNIVSTPGLIDNDGLLPDTINKAGQGLGVNIQTTTTAPITSAPVTSIPITSAPVTPAPVTPAPATSAPVTSAPITSAPVTSTPITSDRNSLASIPTIKTQSSSAAAATSTGNAGAPAETVSTSASSVTGGDGASKTPSVSSTASNAQGSSGASSSASTAQSSTGASAGQSASASTSAGSQ